MSETFSSHLGNLWAKRNLHRVASNFDALLLRTLADCFNRNGQAWPPIRDLIHDMGDRHDRGQVMRGLKALETANLISITNRGEAGVTRPCCSPRLDGTGVTVTPLLQSARHLRCLLTGVSVTDLTGVIPGVTGVTMIGHGSQKRPILTMTGVTVTPSLRQVFKTRIKTRTLRWFPAHRRTTTARRVPRRRRGGDLLGEVPAERRSKVHASDKVTPEAMVAAWNQVFANTRIPPVRPDHIPDRRRKLLRDAVALIPKEGIGVWQALFEWLRPQPWFADKDLDWFLSFDRPLKYLERAHHEIISGIQPEVVQDQSTEGVKAPPREEMVPIPGIGLCRIDADDNFIAPDPAQQEYVSNYQRTMEAQFNPDGSWKTEGWR